MGIMREKYLIGISGTSIALMTIALVWAMPLGMDQASVNDIGSIQGHVTLMAVHPDGTANYIQGDNVIQFDGKNAAANRLFDDTTNQLGIHCIALGTGGATDPTNDDINGVVTPAATATECADDGAPNSITDTTAASAGQSAITDILIVFDIAAGDDGLTIDEVALEDSAGNNAISRFILADGGVGVSTNTVLTITYTMEIT